MDEHEFRDALRGAMVAGSPPPAMNETAALEAARAAYRRRRATIAAAGSALAMVAIAVGAVIVVGSGGSGGPVAPAGQPPAAESPSDSKTVWPTGPDGQPQQDRTATAGPRADRAAHLESVLSAVLPPGLTVMPAPPPRTDTSVQPLPPDGSQAPSMLRNQSQFVERVDGKEVWEYFSMLPVTAGGKAGLVFGMVYTPGNQLPADLCAAARTLWAGYGADGQPLDMGWQCQERSVGALKVGVVSGHHGGEFQFDQWAFYRHQDGTAVFVAQASHAPTGAPRLDSQPFTLDRLAEIATDPRFHLE